jgi:hypothetical protein
MDVLRGIDLEQVEQSKGNKMYESTMLKIAREEKRKRETQANRMQIHKR